MSPETDSSPWQYDWKRPTWNSPSGGRDIRGTPLTIASAYLSNDELDLEQYRSELSLQDLITATSEPSWILTATLFAMDGSKKRNVSKQARAGDAVLLELHCSRNGNGVQCVQHRLLRWPSSALISQAEEEEFPKVEKKKGFWPWSKADDEDDHAEFATPAGLVSLALCRRPLSGTADPAAAVNAIDVIQLMSLNLDRNNETTWSWVPTSPGTTTPILQDRDPAELVLMCLTSGGQVHSYLPLSILGTLVSEDDKDLGSGFSAFMFGSSLFHELQRSLIPLSEPVATVVLSVPLMSKSRQVNRNKVVQDGEGSDEGDESSVEQENLRQSKPVPMWDPNLWDSNVEPSTTIYRTRENVPVRIVSAFGYAAVIGHGIRVRQKLVARKSRRANDSRPSRSVSAGDQTSGSSESSQPERARDDDEEVKVSTGSHWVEYLETGGFVTFISLRHSAEARTVYLPFAPKQLSPIVWGNMCFVLVLGDEATVPSRRPSAVLIRVDSSGVTQVPRGRAQPIFRARANDSSEALSGLQDRFDGIEEKYQMCSVKRFRPLPLIFQMEGCSSTTKVAAVGCSSLFTSPPAVAIMFAAKKATSVDIPLLVVQTLDTFDLVPSHVARESMGGHRRQGKLSENVLAITTKLLPGHFARISPGEDSTDLQAVSCHVGQGWAVLGFPSRTLFLCLEGATVATGSFVSEIWSETSDDSDQALLLSPIIPSQACDTISSIVTPQYSDELEIDKSSADLHLPFTSPYRVPSILKRVDEVDTIPEEKELEVDQIVVDALDSISSVQLERVEPSELLKRPGRPRSLSLSHQEKSQRLLRHCNSWTMLEDNEGSKVLMEGQAPVLAARTGPLGKDQFVLSLRQIAVDNGVAAPFNQILAWLSQSEEYLTAASVALDLLGDADTLRDLRRATDDVASYDTVKTILEGLLDGIFPLYRDPDSWEGGVAIVPDDAVLTQLADMTIGCLTRGGLAMSTTLGNFLGRNKNYDPARASLMLVAATAFCVSDDDESIKSMMGIGYEWPSDGSPAIQDLLWPMRNLLRLGVSREYLSTTLMLVNATIPDELRRRPRPADSSDSRPSMEMCKSLVSMILASSNDAPELLLALTDDDSRDRYWNSLDHETRLELTLLLVGASFPMLRQTEIRDWLLALLDNEIRSEDAESEHKSDTTRLPKQFLRGLCSACLTNAGCDLGGPEKLVNEAGSLGEGEVIDDSDRTVEGEETRETDGSQEHFEEQRMARRALRPLPGRGGLDFDLVVPSLLLLRRRGIRWRDDSNVTTQTVLDAACYLAGRYTSEETLFTMDGSTLVRQCAVAGNVSAGANLIGGRDGLVLKCCDILIHGAGMTMEDAESFILAENVLLRKSSRIKNADTSRFTPTRGHRHILWLLDEHVLSIRTFGEFETIHMRGRVEPVFAARACLRSWWRLSSSHDPSTSSRWLVRWLRQRLGISQETVSRQRLACAALTRAFLWPRSDNIVDTGELDPKSDELLANAMAIESLFLLELCQSCCGLVESVPPTLADELLRQQEAEVPGKSNVARRKSGGSSLPLDVS